MTSNVIIENLTKTYQEGEVTALEDIELKIKEGELFVLLGPSGCGKTTCLHCINGLVKPDRGKVIIQDRVVFDSENDIDVEPQDRGVSMVFQDYAIYPHMTVRENIMFPLKIEGLEESERERRTRETASLLGIENLLDRSPDALSGGQRQRIALGRAIVREPDLFLFDEPLANLDASLRDEMREEIVKLQRRLGVAMVYVTHNQKEAMTIGDRVMVLRDGKIEQIDPPQKMYSSPQTKFVGRFLGSPKMNVISGEIQEKRGKLVFSSNGFEFKVNKDFSEGLEDKMEVEVGIRPQDLHLKEDQFEPETTESEIIKIAGKVTLVERLGDRTIVTSKAGDDIPLKAVVEGNPEIDRGKEVNLVCSQDKVHLFNSTTEEKIKRR